MQDKTFEKYKLVVDEWFINGFNGTKAYQKYYPKVNGNTAGVKFSELVRIGKIEEYKEEKQKALRSTLQTSHKQLLDELYNWAYSDITETLTIDVNSLNDLPPSVRRLITKFKKTTRVFGDDNENKEEAIELWFVSKEKAMEMILKHTGFYEADNAQKSSIEISFKD